MFMLRSRISSLVLSNKSISQFRLYSEDPREKPKEDDNNHNRGELRKKSGQNVDGSLLNRPKFEQAVKKDKKTYLDMISIFKDRDVHRRNHVEFIYAALKNMEAYGVHKDIVIYKALINVMPKGKFIPTNLYQSESMHYPKQQQCIVDLLEQMEDNSVIPDYEMEDMLLNIFGKKGHPVRKYWRMMYWMPKFKNLSPWLLPNPVPDDSLELARMAVERMCTVDLQSKISTFQTSEVENSCDDTWIVSGQSVKQTELLKKHKKDTPIYIEGPFLIWLRDKSVNYFTLRGDPLPEAEPDNTDPDDVSTLKISFLGMSINNTVKSSVAIKRCVHEQDDGIIFAICATGTSTKDSLLSWVRLLGKNGNPDLEHIPVIFKFTSPVSSQLVPLASTLSAESIKP